MDDKIEFNSVKELYDRARPALYSKLKEIRKRGFQYVNEIDIWNYLVDKSWKNKKNLELHELITDILNADNFDINEYVMKKLNDNKPKTEISNIDLGGTR